MTHKAILIGNSDGIGLATTRALLERGWRVLGISRSDSPIEQDNYVHTTLDVSHENYPSTLSAILDQEGPVSLCIYCAGIGELLDPTHMEREVEILEVNLMGLVKTATVVLPRMVSEGSGHFIGLSSLADELLSPEAPSYHASKAGFSSYLESLALALKPRGVRVTNVRFGFVDTKMAKGDVKPLMMPVHRAVRHLLACVDRAPLRFTAPKAAIPLVKLRRLLLRFALLFGGWMASQSR